MSEELTILMTAVDAVGCFNPLIAIGQELIARGHTVIFATPDTWKNRLRPFGFLEEWLNPSTPPPQENSPKVWQDIILEVAPLFRLSPEEQIQIPMGFYAKLFNQMKEIEPRLKEIIDKVKPDVILTEMFYFQPSVMKSGIPWVLSWSSNPVGISDKNVPPALSGYPTGEEYRNKWENYQACFKAQAKEIFAKAVEWSKENGGPDFNFHPPFFMKYSPYANIYLCPEELDYTEFRPNPPNFHRFESFLRQTNEIFEIPEKLRDKPGKLVYFSMGTIGCSEVELMKRIVSILAKSPHRFIVSKGPCSDMFELVDNMWGAASVPQTKIIPMVDLVITHGGNNTVTESLYYGKPMLVLPLFVDQPDNAQRIMETGLGIRLHAYKANDEEVLGAIEKLLEDEILAAKLYQISKRIQGGNNLSKVADLLENVVQGK